MRNWRTYALMLILTIGLGVERNIADAYYTQVCVPGTQVAEPIARACIRHGYVSMPRIRPG